ncbi:hypothetical protein BT69DRAFT_1277575 [Atractiella rhizophila]|nr:hypothetical protein BT69DRAFT_1277575 [Atractiella rhizophila]
MPLALPAHRRRVQILSYSAVSLPKSQDGSLDAASGFPTCPISHLRRLLRVQGGTSIRNKEHVGRTAQP